MHDSLATVANVILMSPHWIPIALNCIAYRMRRTRRPFGPFIHASPYPLSGLWWWLRAWLACCRSVTLPVPRSVLHNSFSSSSELPESFPESLFCTRSHRCVSLYNLKTLPLCEGETGPFGEEVRLVTCVEQRSSDSESEMSEYTAVPFLRSEFTLSKNSEEKKRRMNYISLQF